MNGLFGGVLQTPQERQQIAIRKALEARRDKFEPRPGYFYRGGGDLLLRHGTFYSGRELPQDYSHLFRLDGGAGNCFRNAWHAAKESGLRYCEGVYALGSGHFTPHAWLLDPDGGLLELTMPTDPTEVGQGIEARSGQPVLPPTHWGYWGVVLHVDYVGAISEAEHSYGGTLDRPIHDELFTESDDMDVSERRTHWPIFTYRYDPDRRKP